MNTSLAELWLYLVIYGALGWVGETCVMAVKERQFTNRRFLNLPLSLPYGITAVLLLIGLPELPNGFLEYLLCLVVLILVRVLSDQVLHNFSGQQNHLSISAMNLSPSPGGCWWPLWRGSVWQSTGWSTR